MYTRKPQYVFWVEILVFLFLFFTASINFSQGGTWLKKADIPTARCFASSCELDGKIYVIGGGTNINSSLDVMEIYDPVSDTWDITKKNMPTSRVELCVAAVKGKVYAIGGAFSHSGSTVGVVEEYDPSTDTWTTKTQMPTARKGAAYCVIDEKIYIAGGSAVANWGPSKKLEVYDPATDSWETKSDMKGAIYYPSGDALNNIFYVTGGIIGSPWTGQNTVQKYDPTNNKWELSVNLNDGRVGHTTNAVNGKLYAIGGDKQPPILKNIEKYDHLTETWAVVDTTPSAMIIHTSSVHKNNIYIFSGSTKTLTNLTPTNSVYSYSPYIKAATLVKGSFEFDGRNRNYEVYLPQDYRPNMPVVLALHGYTETIQWFKDYTLMHEYGNTSGFITVYPAAIGKSWNSGLIAPGWPTIDTSVDDVGFISALIDTLKEDYDIDLSRVYCCGFSLGGEMTYRLAIELGHKFAAVASVAGLINDVTGNLDNPIRTIPILHMHGTKDNYETWNGDNKNLWTVPETIDFWINRNECFYAPDTFFMFDLEPNDGCTVEKLTYDNGPGYGSFTFYKIIDGGHSWPNSAFKWSGEGNKNMDINANEEIWNFFKDFNNPLADIGDDWEFQSSGVSNTLLDVHFSDSDHGTVIGTDGTILGTNNGGETWDNQSSKSDIFLSNVCSVNKNISWISSSGDSILYTKDGGLNWIELSFGIDADFNDVIFVDENNGFVSGIPSSGEGIVLAKTKNGGITWEYIFNDTVQPGVICFVDSLNGWIAGENIYHTNDGCLSWNKQADLSQCGIGFKSISFFNKNNGVVICGGTGWDDSLPKVFTTTDGGDNWSSKLLNATCDPKAVQLIDNENGIIVGGSGFGGGSNGEIYKTTDGGSTWEKIVENYPSGFWGVHFTNSEIGTVVGADGIILRTSNGGVTWVEENNLLGVNVKKDFVLHQNYPNPFNPSTTIKYQIPEQLRKDNSFVTIKIYDLLGREVTTLVNEKQKPGNYEVKWNAVNQPSGIYFYELRVGDFIETKKMIFLK